MRININGRDISEEELAEMQRKAAEQEEQRIKQFWKEWEEQRKLYDCNCAIIQINPTTGDWIQFCSLDRHVIPNPKFCKTGCRAYNNKDYSKEDIEADVVSE